MFAATVRVVRRNKRGREELEAVQLAQQRNLGQLCQAWMHFIVGGHTRSHPTFFSMAQAAMSVIYPLLPDSLVSILQTCLVKFNFDLHFSL